jgi:transglutaminase-like putative cysteine protease
MRIALIAALALFGASAHAREDIIYAPPAPWADIAPIPAAPPDDDGGATTRLWDAQKRVQRKTEELFFRQVTQARNAQGISALGTVRVQWDPDFQSVTYHWVRLIRGDQVINVLDDDTKFLVLRREEELERATLTGRLTATLQVEGARAGDMLDVAYTIGGRDPLARGYSDGQYQVEFSRITGRVRASVAWEDGADVRWSATTKQNPTPKTGDSGWDSVVFDATNMKADPRPISAPARFVQRGAVHYTSFPDWGRVAAIMRPLYADAMELKGKSEIPALAKAIATEHATPEARVAAALRLAQEQVRYFALAIGDGGLKPATADETWARRYGDCKGKTVLLLALLKDLGVTAQPALVSIGQGEMVAERLPGLDAFNHVIVRAQIGETVYWLDPTREDGRQALRHIQPPNYRWALPLNAKALQEIVVPVHDQPTNDIVMRIDARAGIAERLPTEVVSIYRGDQAISMRRNVRQTGEQVMRERATDPRRQQDNLTFAAETLTFEDDPVNNVYTTRSSGKMKTHWVLNEDVNRPELELNDSGGATNRPKRTGEFEGVPLSMPYPVHSTYRVEVLLPNGGEGYFARGPNTRFENTATLQIHETGIANGVAFTTSAIRSKARELPAAEVMALRRFEEGLKDQPFLLRAPVGAALPPPLE